MAQQQKQRIFPVVWCFVGVNGETLNLELMPDGVAYLATPGCTCRPIPIPEAGRVMIGGVDDCPVHGFGVNGPDETDEAVGKDESAI